MENLEATWRRYFCDNFDIAVGMLMRMSDVQCGRFKSISSGDVDHNFMVDNCVEGILVWDAMLVRTGGEFNCHTQYCSTLSAYNKDPYWEAYSVCGAGSQTHGDVFSRTVRLADERSPRVCLRLLL